MHGNHTATLAVASLRQPTGFPHVLPGLEPLRSCLWRATGLLAGEEEWLAQHLTVPDASPLPPRGSQPGQGKALSRCVRKGLGERSPSVEGKRWLVLKYLPG